MRTGRIIAAVLGILIFLLLVALSIMIKARFIDTLLRYPQEGEQVTYSTQVF